MLDQVKKLMEMKKQADILKKELEATIIEVSESRGIKLVVNGAQIFQSIEIDESLLNAGNKNRIQMDLLKNLNTAVKRSQQAAANKMKNMPGFNLPGLS
ncbi:MAG: YbaB/EbfC family nucleoid-associated protein [Candidatus Omnitrophica bacterium]|nr:YbaB/EbfC family nucleoid-associated protein [Candidatus Omnitrophota bacterium]MDE2009190.1 YbaB/EbfC family nucleoid-associated protein [Candidatus Omnitrophota bacterium]MDE2213711.1 YbaB/EbfC family nucleoid-associated protein [Candidatus Omnitrophota bacterium]MDE2230714.1 YbaB/EbfC family nucleoid-associated protein [Candidatus Omnitrophota bacterium]